MEKTEKKEDAVAGGERREERTMKKREKRMKKCRQTHKTTM